MAALSRSKIRFSVLNLENQHH